MRTTTPEVALADQRAHQAWRRARALARAQADPADTEQAFREAYTAARAATAARSTTHRQLDARVRLGVYSGCE